MVLGFFLTNVCSDYALILGLVLVEFQWKVWAVY